MSEFVPVLVENEPAPERPGPGARLRAARIERQLEVSAVASALHIAARLVTAMEEDRFEEFDAPVYARGFLRTYARFLNLSADEILAAYEALAGSPPPPTLIPPANARPLPRDFAPLRKAGLLVLALLLVGVSFWWWIGRVAPPAAPVAATAVAPAAPAETAAVTDGDGGEVALPAPEAVTLGGTPDAAPAAATTPAPAAASVPVASPGSAAPPPAPAVATRTASATPAAGPAPSPGTAAAPAPTTARTASPPTPAPAPPAGAKNAPTGQPPPPLVTPVVDGPQIVLRGKKDCWVEVRAAGGARLFYGLVRPGETHTMPGPAPWFVYLGYADGIEVSVGGHVIEVPAARREGAKARFGVAADGSLR